MSRRATPVLLAALGALMASAAPTLQAQSLLGASGLGLPLNAMDARAWVLGGIGVGLPGGQLQATDPAAAADLAIPSLTFTMQSSWVDAEENGTTGESSATRFPALAASYPVAGVGVVSVGFGSVLDQRWRLERSQTLVLEGSGTEAKVGDVFESDGGVSAIRVGLARRVLPTLAVGFQVGTHLGDVTRRFTRTFDSLEVETSVPPYQIGGLWSYSGLTATVGAGVDLGSVVHLAGSYTWSADLEAEPTSDTEGGPGRFVMPGEIRVGGTAVLAPQLSLSAGVHWADWSDTRTNQGDVVGRSALALGGGLEWRGARILGKPGALRLGYRRRDLPFPADGADATESAFTGGVGLNLLQSAGAVLSTLDLSLERGLRDAGSLEERFWRLSTSVRISGF